MLPNAQNVCSDLLTRPWISDFSSLHYFNTVAQMDTAGDNIIRRTCFHMLNTGVVIDSLHFHWEGGDHNVAQQKQQETFCFIHSISSQCVGYGGSKRHWISTLPGFQTWFQQKRPSSLQINQRGLVMKDYDKRTAACCAALVSWCHSEKETCWSFS